MAVYELKRANLLFVGIALAGGLLLLWRALDSPAFRAEGDDGIPSPHALTNEPNRAGSSSVDRPDLGPSADLSDRKPAETAHAAQGLAGEPTPPRVVRALDNVPAATAQELLAALPDDGLFEATDLSPLHDFVRGMRATGHDLREAISAIDENDHRRPALILGMSWATLDEEDRAWLSNLALESLDDGPRDARDGFAALRALALRGDAVGLEGVLGHALEPHRREALEGRWKQAVAVALRHMDGNGEIPLAVQTFVGGFRYHLGNRDRLGVDWQGIEERGRIRSWRTRGREWLALRGLASMTRAEYAGAASQVFHGKIDAYGMARARATAEYLLGLEHGFGVEYLRPVLTEAPFTTREILYRALDKVDSPRTVGGQLLFNEMLESSDDSGGPEWQPAELPVIRKLITRSEYGNLSALETASAITSLESCLPHMGKQAAEVAEDLLRRLRAL